MFSTTQKWHKLVTGRSIMFLLYRAISTSQFIKIKQNNPILLVNVADFLCQNHQKQRGPTNATAGKPSAIDCNNSSALAMELLHSCGNLSIFNIFLTLNANAISNWDTVIQYYVSDVAKFVLYYTK